MPSSLSRIGRGIAGAVKARPGVLISVAILMLLVSVFLPPLVLSVARKPADYFAFNAWLPQLPDYVLRTDISIQQKLGFIPHLALFWFTADDPMAGVDWGFAVTVGDLLRFLLFGLLLGLYFALVFYRRDRAGASSFHFAQGGGASGAVASLFGISTGGCTVMGCGAPVIPVIGLAFAGLSSGTLALLAGFSVFATITVLLLIFLGIGYLAWVAGAPAASAAAQPAPVHSAA